MILSDFEENFERANRFRNGLPFIFYILTLYKVFKNIMLRIILITIGIGILLFIAPEIGLSQYVHPQKWMILAFFFAISYFNHILMQFGFANNRENFVKYYLGSITSRMILSLIFIGIFLYSNIPNPYIFLLDFFVLYLCYTGFEIFGLFSKLRHFS
jgi:hypothetical protein